MSVRSPLEELGLTLEEARAVMDKTGLIRKFREALRNELRRRGYG